MLSEAITEDSIQLNVDAKSFEEAIYKSTFPMVEQGYMDSKYVQEIINIYKEIGPYIVITQNIALPHAPSEFGAKKMGIGFTRLKVPVKSGNDSNDPVKFLFPLSAPDSSSHIALLSELADLLSDRAFIEFLDTAESKEQIIDYLKKYEGVD